MTTPKENALRQEGVNNTFTKETYHINILTHLFCLVKKRMGRIAISFWRVNYNLESNRQEHASLGHLWRQIGYCVVLLAFRLAGKVAR